MIKQFFYKRKSILLPLGVLILGGCFALILVKTGPVVEQGKLIGKSPLVHVVSLAKKAQPISITTHGKVIPSRKITLQSELSGRVVWQHDALIAGGRLKQGEIAVRIDARDYELALKQQQAHVSRAQLELDVEKGRRKVAEQAWKLLEDKKNINHNESLVLRDPQLRTAEVTLASMQSSLRKARLNIKRTAIRVPFNALVLNESAEIGQWVNQQTMLGTLVGTDSYWIQISIPVEQLSYLMIPQVNIKEKRGSKVTIVQTADTQHVTRTGYVFQLLGDLDPVGGMARLLVTVNDPLGLDNKDATGLPLFLGAFVDVTLDGGMINNVVSIPRTAIQTGNTVLIVDDQSILRAHKFTIVWDYIDHVLAYLDDITYPIVVGSTSTLIPGMKVRISNNNSIP